MCDIVVLELDDNVGQSISAECSHECYAAHRRQQRDSPFTRAIALDKTELGRGVAILAAWTMASE